MAVAIDRLTVIGLPRSDSVTRVTRVARLTQCDELCLEHYLYRMMTAQVDHSRCERWRVVDTLGDSRRLRGLGNPTRAVGSHESSVCAVT